MALPGVETVVVAEELAKLLRGVEGLRVYWAPLDTVRPPAAVIGQPDVDYTDSTSGFCTATWSFPITLIVARGSGGGERDSQALMSRLLMEAAQALAAEVPGIFSIEPVGARPITASVGQTELPGYQMDVRVRA